MPPRPPIHFRPCLRACLETLSTPSSWVSEACQGRASQYGSILSNRPSCPPSSFSSSPTPLDVPFFNFGLLIAAFHTSESASCVDVARRIQRDPSLKAPTRGTRVPDGSVLIACVRICTLGRFLGTSSCLPPRGTNGVCRFVKGAILTLITCSNPGRHIEKAISSYLSWIQRRWVSKRSDAKWSICLCPATGFGVYHQCDLSDT